MCLVLVCPLLLPLARSACLVTRSCVPDGPKCYAVRISGFQHVISLIVDMLWFCRGGVVAVGGRCKGHHSIMYSRHM